MWPIKTILFFLLFSCGCALSLFNPLWGVLNYMLVYQTNPTDTWWGKPLVELGVRFSLLTSLCVIAGLALGAKQLPRIERGISAWEVGLIAVVIIAAATQAFGFGTDPLASAYAFEKLWKMFVFVLILTRVAASRRNFRCVLWIIVIGMLYLGWDAYTANPDDFVHGRLEEIGGADFSTTSGAAAHTVAMLPLIGAVFLTTRNWWAKAVTIVAGGLAMNTFILCRTRSAFLGLLVGAIVAGLLAPRSRRHRIHALLIVGALAAFSLTDNYFWERIATLTDRQALDQDLATVNRREIWKTSARVVADHPFGIGPGNAPTVIGLYDARYWRRSTHNTLVVAFVEFGVPGGVLFLIMAFLSLWYLRNAKRLADQTKNPMETRIYAYALLVSLVTYLVTGLGTERFYCESFWWVMALPLILCRIAEAEAAESRRTADMANAADDETESPEPDDDPFEEEADEPKDARLIYAH